MWSGATLRIQFEVSLLEKVASVWTRHFDLSSVQASYQHPINKSSSVELNVFIRALFGELRRRAARLLGVHSSSVAR